MESKLQAANQELQEQVQELETDNMTYAANLKDAYAEIRKMQGEIDELNTENIRLDDLEAKLLKENHRLAGMIMDKQEKS